MKRLFALLIFAVLTLGVATVCSQAVDQTPAPAAKQQPALKKTVKRHHRHAHYIKKKPGKVHVPVFPKANKK